MTEPKKPRVTPKQARIVERKVKAVLNDEPQRKWAQELYPNSSPAAAEVEVSKNLNKPNVKEALELALAHHGITIEKAVRPIADGLQATRTIPTSEGLVEGIDHATRLKASGMALKLMGADKQEDKGGNTIIFSNTANFNSRDYMK